jgi:hypothetical protein
MLKAVLTTLILTATSSMAFAEASRPTRFWNLTRHTISELSLAPAGTTNFGPNQCKNDKDGEIEIGVLEIGAGKIGADQRRAERSRSSTTA